MSSLRRRGQGEGERLALEQYAAVRPVVLAQVQSTLRKANVFVPEPEVDAAYNRAWTELVRALDAGEDVQNLPGWLVRTTYRRALDAWRVAHPAEHVEADLSLMAVPAESGERFAERVDAVDALRATVTVLKRKFSAEEARIAAMTLSERSRPQIAEELDISRKRLNKILDGHNGKPGLLSRLGAYIEVIARGEWCEFNGSLIRAYTLGVLRPGSAKVAEAQEHLRGCAGCREYSREYLRAKDQLASMLPFVWAGGATADRSGLLQQAIAIARAPVDWLRSLLGIGGSEGVAAAGGASVGGGALALGGLSAGKVVGGCVALVAGGTCLAAVGGALPTPGGKAPERSAEVVTAPPRAQSPPASGQELRSMLALDPLKAFVPSRSAAQRDGGGKTRAATRGSASILVPNREFGIEAPGRQASRAAGGERRARRPVTRDMDIENTAGIQPRTTTSTPAPAAPAAPAPSAPAPQSATPPAGGQSGGSSPPARAPAEPQRESFGIER